MDDPQATVKKIFQEFYQQALDAGITITGQDQESGGFYIPNADGETMLVRLDNLLDYYWKTHDENAVATFVAKIKDMTRIKEQPTWEEAREHIYISLYPNNSEARSPYARDVTEYFNRFYILDTPTRQQWVFPELAAKWGVGEEELEKEALNNAERLLAASGIKIEDVDGHPLGSFGVKDRTLNAACLFAPGMKDAVSKGFGWPVYVIFPDKVTCYFFGKDHFDYFSERVAGLVTEKYAGARKLTPELLEINDQGVNPICSWSQQLGQIVRFDS